MRWAACRGTAKALARALAATSAVGSAGPWGSTASASSAEARTLRQPTRRPPSAETAGPATRAAQRLPVRGSVVTSYQTFIPTISSPPPKAALATKISSPPTTGWMKPQSCVAFQTVTRPSELPAPGGLTPAASLPAPGLPRSRGRRGRWAPAATASADAARLHRAGGATAQAPHSWSARAAEAAAPGSLPPSMTSKSSQTMSVLPLSSCLWHAAAAPNFAALRTGSVAASRNNLASTALAPAASVVAARA
mmetsp:Transcript_33073/g.95081  ORF Transcript_33073/g.95081 Transcript_33073/m.95081 type:complete len:251 (-) Transcript_33073:1030-1782(-)